MSASSITIRNFATEIPGALSADHTEWIFPVVRSTSAKQQALSWQIMVRLQDTSGTLIDARDALKNEPLPVNYVGCIRVESSISSGVIKKSSPTIITTGKNLGKKNATNVFCQALRDALSTYNKQVKRAGTGAIVLPMLAQVYQDCQGKLEWPLINAVVQRKYNGVRAIVNLAAGTPRPAIYSRSGTEYMHLPMIRAEIAEFIEIATKIISAETPAHAIYFDGELYKHGLALQDIAGPARRAKAETPDIDYMIYDLYVSSESTATYSQRYDWLCRIFAEASSRNIQCKCKLVESIGVATDDDIMRQYDAWISEGFEGAMLRLDAPYVPSVNGYHCRSLLKIKPTLDAEYRIVGFTADGRGKAAGALMIVCETATGQQFPCTPALELPERIALAAQMAIVEPNHKTHFENAWLGRFITVYFAEFSKDKIPQQGRTKLEQRAD